MCANDIDITRTKIRISTRRVAPVAINLRPDQEGTEAQMEVFLGMADRKLTELKEQQIQLAETLDELEKLRQTTHQMLNKNK